MLCNVSSTYSNTKHGSDGKSWLKVNLAKLNCIHQVIWYGSTGDPIFTYTCTSSNCSTGNGGNVYSLTTSAERTSSYLPLIADCKYVDTVKLQEDIGFGIGVYEVAIIGKQGEIRYW